ncbi:MAG: hypothetical protein ACJAVK_003544 [Akkermansiaceae bacterium]|jgi:hypothetical protein
MKPMKAFVCFPLFCFAVFLTGCTVYDDVEPQVSGWRAPALVAPDQYGRPVNLKAATSGPWAIVFFYPEADTPG